MAQNDYLDFDFNKLPEKFEHTFDDVSYTMRLYYNSWSDAFYIDIWDENDVEIVYGERLVYGESLWESINDQRLPLVQLVPLDEDDIESTVSALNFPTQVRLYFIESEVTDDVVTDSDDVSLLDEDTIDDDSDDDSTDADINPYGNDPTVGGDF